MELDEIVRRFGALCGLTPEEAKAEEAQCAAALARGATVAIGDPAAGPGGARDAARALEEDYRRTAAPWLRPAGFCFRPAAGGKGVSP